MSETESPVTRILAHMNKDHKIAIEDYLYFHGQVKPDPSISRIKLKEITLEHMVITFKYKGIKGVVEKVISFDEKVEQWADMRTKLVDMAKEAAKGRGLSHVEIYEIDYPKLVHAPLIAVVLLLLGSIFDDAVVYYTIYNPVNYLVHDLAGLPFSAFDFWFKWVVDRHNWVLLITIVVHVLEMVFNLLPLMKFYRTPGDIQFEWMFMTLIEGFPCICRYKKLVDEVLNKGRKQIRDHDKLT